MILIATLSKKVRIQDLILSPKSKVKITCVVTGNRVGITSNLTSDETEGIIPINCLVNF